MTTQLTIYYDTQTYPAYTDDKPSIDAGQNHWNTMKIKVDENVVVDNPFMVRGTEYQLEDCKMLYNNAGTWTIAFRNMRSFY